MTQTQLVLGNEITGHKGTYLVQTTNFAKGGICHIELVSRKSDGIIFVAKEVKESAPYDTFNKQYDRARHSEADIKKLYVKYLQNTSLTNSKFIEKEKNALSILRGHPYIISLEDTAICNDQLLIMEFANMPKLTSYISGYTDSIKIEQEMILMVMWKIIKALQYCHEYMIIHRDLKPGNIFFNHQTGNLKIIDFNVAKLFGEEYLENLSLVNQSVGTFSYMAPEQFSTTAITFAADIYSLGIICYELFTGQKPFYLNLNNKEGENDASKWLEYKKSCPLKPLGVSPSLDKIIAEMIQPDANKRFKTMEEVEAAFRTKVLSQYPKITEKILQLEQELEHTLDRLKNNRPWYEPASLSSVQTNLSPPAATCEYDALPKKPAKEIPCFCSDTIRQRNPLSAEDRLPPLPPPYYDATCDFTSVPKRTTTLPSNLPPTPMLEDQPTSKSKPSFPQANHAKMSFGEFAQECALKKESATNPCFENSTKNPLALQTQTTEPLSYSYRKASLMVLVAICGFVIGYIVLQTQTNKPSLPAVKTLPAPTQKKHILVAGKKLSQSSPPTQLAVKQPPNKPPVPSKKIVFLPKRIYESKRRKKGFPKKIAAVAVIPETTLTKNPGEPAKKTVSQPQNTPPFQPATLPEKTVAIIDQKIFGKLPFFTITHLFGGGLLIARQTPGQEHLVDLYNFRFNLLACTFKATLLTFLNLQSGLTPLQYLEAVPMNEVSKPKGSFSLIDDQEESPDIQKCSLAKNGLALRVRSSKKVERLTLSLENNQLFLRTALKKAYQITGHQSNCQIIKIFYALGHLFLLEKCSGNKGYVFKILKFI